jgi:hypothetical protein
MQSYESNPPAKYAMLFPWLAKLQIGQRIRVTKPLLELSADTPICRLDFFVDWTATYRLCATQNCEVGTLRVVLKCQGEINQKI